MPRLHLRQVGTNRPRVSDDDVDHHVLHDDARLDRGHGGSGHHRGTGRDQHIDHGAVARGIDGVVHLHRLDQHQLLAGADGVACCDVDRDDRALHRSLDPHLPHPSDGSWRDRIRLLL